jgi:hypothetical protein
VASRSRKRRPGVPPARDDAPASPEAAAPAPADGERAAPLAGSAAASALSAGEERSEAAEAPANPADPVLDRYARGRARDAAVRMSLEPLAPGERPGAVTIAAVVAFVFAIANVVATLTVDDLTSTNGDPTAVAIVTTALLVFAGVGMLARKYWAVLGFQCILGLQIVGFSLALSRVQKWWIGLGLIVFIGLLGWLFWKLIRAMARLQMPDRPGDAESTR